MRYTVSWAKAAESHSAELWLEASDPAKLAAAADEIDRVLAVNPLSLGESRVGNSRILIQLPIGVLFEVSADDREVRVWSVWIADN